MQYLQPWLQRGIFEAGESVLESEISLKSDESKELDRITEFNFVLETDITSERDTVS